MNITDDMKTLSEQHRRIIARFANTLLKKLPDTHTIIMTRRPGLKIASVLTDYELIIFVGGGANGANGANGENEVNNCRCKCRCDDESKSRKPKSSASNVYAAAAETYPICNPQMDYIHSSRLVDKEEAEALTYEFKDVHEDTRHSFLECLRKHLMFFVKRESISVTTVNTTEMQKKNRLYHRLYMIFKLETGYVLYNRDTRPMVTLNKRL